MDTLPWVEKYRPQTLEDIVGNTSAIQQFKSIAKNGNIPHMIFSGAPGTGKTTSVICLAKTLLGDKFNDAFLELNASDERGIDIIRSKISMFCKKKVNLPEGRHKIIFLDEVDSMTSPAQQALRRIIELHAQSTRFVMACNTSTKIIEAIQSRCSVLRFGRIDDDSMYERMVKVCELEEAEYNEDALRILIQNCDGDMRNAINNLQAVVTTYQEVTEDHVRDIIDRPDSVMIDNLLDKCLKKDFDGVNEIATELVENGYSTLDVIQILFISIKSYELEIEKKLKILDYIGDTQMNLINGGEPYLQLMALVSRIILL
jgi:replication factor C subunit 2/4